MPKYSSFDKAPLEVRQRYFRIKYAKHLMKITRFFLRVKLTILDRKRNKTLTATLATYKRETERARHKGNECTQVLMNIGLFYLIAEKDIQAVKIDALTHHDYWKRQLSLRVILLTIHEWDMSKASSRKLKSLLKQSNVDETLQSELFVALRLLRNAQKKAAKYLQFERNATIAHRDSDALLQLRTINMLSPRRVLGACEEFYDSSEHFMKAFPEVLIEAGSLEGMFSFMLRAERT